MRSGSLNLLEPSGPYRACYGTPLHLPDILQCSFYRVPAYSSFHEMSPVGAATVLSDTTAKISVEI